MWRTHSKNNYKTTPKLTINHKSFIQPTMSEKLKKCKTSLKLHVEKIVARSEPTSKSYWIFGVLAVLFSLRYGIDYLVERKMGDPRVFDKEKPYFEIDNFMNNDEIEELKEYVFARQRFTTGKEAFADGVEHLGEGVPVAADGSCPSDELFATGHGMCVVPGRLDIGRHYFMTGGLSGAKETFQKLISSVFSFYQVLPKSFIDTNPMMQKMFKKPEYLQAMNTLCAADGTKDFYFRPIQVNVVVVTPGQDLPLHYDNGWFWGANRFTMPDYLTVAMSTSGLFEDIKIRQAQSVVYLHGSKEEPYFKHGADYQFWPNGPGGERKTIRAKRGSAVIMDGGQIPHGGGRIAEDYKVKNHGSKDFFHRLEHQGNDTWYLIVRRDEENDDIIDKLHTDDLRVSFVWRGLCFDNKEQADSYESYPEIPLDNILDTFEEDLRKRGQIKEGQPRPEPLEFALMLIDNYTKMPPRNIHNKFIFNYCIISKKFPWMKPFLAPFCTDVDPFTSLNDVLPPAKQYCSTDGKPGTNCPDN